MRTPCVPHRDAEGTAVADTEWLQKNAPIDKMVAAALPPFAELETMTFDAILTMHGGTIVLAAKGLGIDLTDAEVEEIIERLVGVKEWSEFRCEHYTVLR